MTETTPRLGLPFIIASQAQKHITHNEALRDLDVLVHLTVEDNTQTTPPTDATDGQCYVVADGATGEWSGRATQIAVRKDQAWHFYIPTEGWTCWLRSKNAMMVFEGYAWIDIISPNAQRGQSAFELALAQGFEGTVDEWLASLKGADGAAGVNGTHGQDGKDGINGTNGADGTPGQDGADGTDGKSAYQLALDAGYSGTLAQWLTSLNGTDGANGTDGKDGANGTNGADGAPGQDGADGTDGKSAYQLALDAGFSGTLAQWLTSLNGTDGKNGRHGVDGLNGHDGKSAYDLARDAGYTGSLSEWLQSLKGKDGNDGTSGSSDWNSITNKPRIEARHITIFENFLSGTNQNVNVTSGVRLEWDTTGVYDSDSVNLLSKNHIQVGDSGQFTIFASVGVLDSSTRERTTLAGSIEIHDSIGNFKQRYNLGSMYLRDDSNRFDSGIVAGQVTLELRAGDQISIAVHRIDSRYSDATYAHPQETKLLIERIDYELV